MAVQVASVYVKIGAKLDELRNGLLESKQELNKFGRDLEKVGKKLTTAVTLPLIGIGVGAVKMSSDLDREMRNIQSISKQTDAEIAALSDTFVELSTDVTKTTDTATRLAAGFYDIQSSGFAGANAMQVLEVSTKAASAGLTQTSVASKAIVSTLNAYGLTAQDAAHVSDVLFRTVDIGVLSFEELAQNLGDVVGTGAVAGVSIEELGAAMATMTKSGISAAEASTALNQLMLSFISPADGAKNAAEELGVELNAGYLAANGLSGAMQLISDKAGGNAEALAELFPNVRALKGALSLTRDEMKPFAADLETIATAAGATQAAFDIQMKAFEAQWKNFRNNAVSAAMDVGEILMPILQDLMNNTIKPMIEWFKGLNDGTKKWIVSVAGIAAAVGPALVVMGSLAQAVSRITLLFDLLKASAAGGWAAALGPIAAAVALIIALTAAIAGQVQAEKEQEAAIAAVGESYKAYGYEAQQVAAELERRKRLITDDINLSEENARVIVELTDRLGELTQQYNDVGVKVREVNKYQSDFNDVGAKTALMLGIVKNAVEDTAVNMTGWIERGKAMTAMFNTMKEQGQEWAEKMADAATSAFGQMYQTQQDKLKQMDELHRQYLIDRAAAQKAGDADQLAQVEWNYERQKTLLEISSAEKLNELRNNMIAQLLVESGLHSESLSKLAAKFGIEKNLYIQQAIFREAYTKELKRLMDEEGASLDYATQKAIEHALKVAAALGASAAEIQALYDKLNNVYNAQPQGGGSGGSSMPSPVSPVEAIEDTVAKAAAAIKAGIEALNELVKWGGVKLATVRANAEKLAEAMNEVIVALVHAAWKFGGAERDWRDIPKAAAEFAGWVSTTMGAISAAVDAIKKIAEGKQVSAERVDKFLGNLQYILLKFSEKFGSRAKDWFKDIAEWSPNVQTAMDMLGSAADVITSVMDGKQVSAERVDKFLGNLWYILDRFERKFAAVGKDWYAVIAEWSPNVEAAMSLLGGAASAITAITDGKQVAASRVDTFIKNLWYILDETGKRFGGYGKDWFSKIAEWSPNVEKAMGLLGNASSAISAIAEGKQVSAARVDQFLKNLWYVLDEMGKRFGGYGAGWFGKIAEWAPNAEKAMNLLGNASGAITSIMDGKQVSAARVDQFLKNLWYVLTEFAKKFSDPNDPALYGAGWYSTIAQWAPNAEKAIGLLANASSAITAIMDGKQVSAARVDTFIENLWYVLTEFAKRFSDPKNRELYGAGWFSVIAKWAPNAEKAMSLLVGAASAISAVVESKTVSTEKVTRFLDSLWQVLKAFSEKFGPSGFNIGAGWYGIIAEWAPNAEKAVSLMSSAVTAMTGMATGLLPSFPRITAFVDKLMETLQYFADKFSEKAKDWLSNQGGIAEDAAKIMGAMNSALGMFKALEEFTGGKWISPAKIDTLISMMQYVMEAFVWLGYYVGPIVQEASRVFAEDVKATFDAMKSALDFFGSLAEEALPARDKVDAFLRLLQEILGKFQAAESAMDSLSQSTYGAARDSVSALENAWVAAYNLGMMPDGLSSGSSSTGSLGGLSSGSSSTGSTPTPRYPVPPAGGGWQGFDAPPSYGGGGGGGGGVGDKAEFYLKNIAEDIHDLLYIERLTAERAGDSGLVSEINRLLGKEAFIWART